MELGSINNLIAALYQKGCYSPYITVSEGRARLKALEVAEKAKEAKRRK